MSVSTLIKKRPWSPYFAGCCIGTLSALSFIVFHKTVGASVFFVKIAAIFWWIFDSRHLSSSFYYPQYVIRQPVVDFQFMLIIGVFLGSFLAVRFSTTRKLGQLHPRSFLDRIVSFTGGAIVIFGARLAGGCTSGHAISGGMQLAVSGWLFMGAVFLSGIPTAFFLKKVRG